MPPRPRSGLQKEVLSLYRRGLQNVSTKPEETRENFLLHLRWSFRHPVLTVRDHAAIEHQIRRFTRTLDMLEEPSVRQMSVSRDMIGWWEDQVERARAKQQTQNQQKEEQEHGGTTGQGGQTEAGDSGV